MNDVQTIFIIVYMVTVVVFLWMPKTGFDNIIKRDFDKDFDPKRMKDVGYYRMVILGGGIVAGVITFLTKIIFY